MSSVPLKFFEPSYIWNPPSVDTPKRGIWSRIWKPSDKKVKVSDKSDVLHKAKDYSGIVFVKISDNTNSEDPSLLKFTFKNKNGESKSFMKSVSNSEAQDWLCEVLSSAGWKLKELDLQLNSFTLTNKSIPTLEVGKMYLKVSSVEMVDNWLAKVHPHTLSELNLAPYAETPISLPREVFDKPHFVHSRVLRISQHCHFEESQFLTLCESTPHFSFYSDTLDEDTVRKGVENHIKNIDTGDFTVMEWLFGRRVDTERVMKRLVRPDGHKQERLNHPKGVYESVDIFFVVHDSDKKLSMMTAKDVSSREIYSLALYA